MKQSDKQLLMIKEGDIEAFERLMAPYSPGFYQAVAKRTGNRERAEELTCELVLRLYRKICTSRVQKLYPGVLFKMAYDELKSLC